MRTDRNLVALSMVCFLILAGNGCKDVDPPPTRYANLGTQGQPLPPTAGAWTNAAIQAGTAEWVAFREPDLDAFALTAHRADSNSEETAPLDEPVLTPIGHNEGVSDAPDADGSEEVAVEKVADAAFSSDEIEAELREVVTEFNEVAAEGDFDALLDFFVESQHDTLTELGKTAKELSGKVDALLDALESKAKGSKDSLSDFLAFSKRAASINLNIERYNIASENEAVGILATTQDRPGVANEVLFTIVDDEWYLEIPALDQMMAALPALEANATLFDKLTSQIKSGKVPASAVVKQLKKMAKSLAGASKSGP